MMPRSDDELELGPIDKDDTRIDYGMRWIDCIDRIKPSERIDWPRDTIAEYLVESRELNLSEALTEDYLHERVREVFTAIDGHEPSGERVTHRVEEMLSTGDWQIVHAESMNIPQGGIEPVTPISAGPPRQLMTAEEQAAEERERAAKIRAMLEGRRP